MPVVWVSCDPRTGKLAVYPQHIQKILESNYVIFLHNGWPAHIDLGPGFFHMIILFFVNNQHEQRTGEANYGHGIAGLQGEGERRTLELKPEFPLTGQTVPVWLFKVKNIGNKWLAYSQQHTDAIEEAYNNDQASVAFMLNGLKMQIRFGEPREFSHQRCVENSNRGYFVCKVHRIEVEPEEAEAMMKQTLDPESMCPIYQDTFHDPNLSIDPDPSIEVERQEAGAMMKEVVDPESECLICWQTSNELNLSIECLQCCANKICTKCLQECWKNGLKQCPWCRFTLIR